MGWICISIPNITEWFLIIINQYWQDSMKHLYKLNSKNYSILNRPFKKSHFIIPYNQIIQNISLPTWFAKIHTNTRGRWLPIPHYKHFKFKSDFQVLINGIQIIHIAIYNVFGAQALNVNSLGPKQNGSYFAEHISKGIYFKENFFFFFSFKFNNNLFRGIQMTINHHQFHQWLGVKGATSNYLN